MPETLANQLPDGNEQDFSSEKHLCIVKGPHRLRQACWAAVHAMTLQGFAAVRIGNEVIVFPADTQEGTA